MTAYQEILEKIAILSKSEQNQLFQELKNRLSNLEDEEDFNEEDLEESESEWQNYINKKDLGEFLFKIELD